jgi:hypothetical protein
MALDELEEFSEAWVREWRCQDTAACCKACEGGLDQGSRPEAVGATARPELEHWTTCKAAAVHGATFTLMDPTSLEADENPSELQ